ncbi:dolichyl-diphosphooligosaccharide--protein glycosyltransferase subunit 4A [Andrographis paniculata]|nr:dolichyl-diphosphooligosaccharide--protein glycosyltransferase subunit 4A [Andrographis paniculata]
MAAFSGLGLQPAGLLVGTEATRAILQFTYFDFKMIDDQDLGFFANFLGIFIFVLVIAYHFVMADPKYEGN